jgi:hypothetical protein
LADAAIRRGDNAGRVLGLILQKKKSWNPRLLWL